MTGASGSAPSVAPEVGDLAARLAAQDLEIRSLCAEVLERYEEATFVYRLSERIGTALGERAIAQLVLEDLAHLLGARVGEVWLRDGGALVLAAAHPPDLSVEDGLRDLHAMGAAEQGRPWLRAGGADVEPAMVVPLPDAGGATLGSLVLRGRAPGRSYRTGDLKLVTAIASLTAAFIRIDRLAAKAREAERRAREDEIARQVHKGLLPREAPSFEGVEISGGFAAAETVGGDYYGYVPMSDGSLGIAMADVSGHGVGAALCMATAKGAIQSEGRRILSPAALLRRTNEVLVGDFSGVDMFATGVFVRIEPGGLRAVYANAGHHPPLLVRATGAIEELTTGGPALGVLPDADFEETAVDLRDGDLLAIYTDGLVEARDAARRFFGSERLVRAIRRASRRSAGAVLSAVFESLARHVGGRSYRDDVTLVVVRAVNRSGGSRGGRP